MIDSQSVAALLVGVLSLVSVSGVSAKDSVNTRDILGWVELVEFAEPRVRLKAKLDTGATTSSLNALNIEPFERDGREWVRFEMLDPVERQESILFEAPVVRTARIRRHEGPTQLRVVVEMGMCIGTVWRKRQFTLIDRSDFAYQVLVGRNFLRGHIAVDSDATYLSRPACKQLGSTPLAHAPAEPAG